MTLYSWWLICFEDSEHSSKKWEQFDPQSNPGDRGDLISFGNHLVFYELKYEEHWTNYEGCAKSILNNTFNVELFLSRVVRIMIWATNDSLYLKLYGDWKFDKQRKYR